MNKPYPFYSLPAVTNLKQMVKNQAEENPDRIAFRFREGKRIKEKSIGEFLSDINAAGTWLFHEGILQCHVALIAPNSYAWLVVFFAVTNSGNVIVPIDKDLPSEEKRHLIEHSECQFVFADSKTIQQLGQLAEFASLIDLTRFEVLLTTGRQLIGEGNSTFTKYQPDVESPAAIVYTSGTTGRSKGVVLSQKNIVSNVNACCKSFNPMGDALSILPFHHMFGLVPALIMFINYRSTVFICTSLKSFMQDLQEAKPKTIMLVPLFIQSFWKMLQRGSAKDLRNILGGNLEYILVGGAPLDPFFETAFHDQGIHLIPAYGATECSPGIAVNRNYFYRIGSVGQPIDGCGIKIADDGEILICGDNVFSEYYRDPEATREALIDGWYHSGDIGYLDADGFLFLTGRKKNLIILSNGENISPEQLETRIAAVYGVSEVLVFDEGDAIAAEIYPDSDHRDQIEYFRRETNRINESLRPSLRIQHVYLRQTEFPKNHTGKILRDEARKARRNEND